MCGSRTVADVGAGSRVGDFLPPFRANSGIHRTLDAALLVLLLQRGELPPATADAMLASARAVLGASATVDLVQADAVDDSAALREGAARHATIVVELRSDENRVHVRVLVVSENRWADRDIGFSDRDRPEERGRTLGFAVASMMPDAPPPPVVPVTPVLPVRPEQPPVAPPLVPRRWYGAVDAMGVGAVGLGGAGGGWGAMLAGVYQPRAPWGLRLAVSPRFGEIVAAKANTITVVTSLGVTLQVGAPRPWTVGFGARVDVLAAYVEVTHFSPDDVVPDRQSRWLAGFDAAIEGTLRLAPALSFVLALGIEGFFGSTDVYVRGQPAATMSPLRLLGEAGIRARF